jgi:hypothetical protein
MKHTLGLLAAMLALSSASGQTMYRCEDLGKTIYSDKPCLNGKEVKQIASNGNPTAEFLAKQRMKDRAEEQRATNAARALKREAGLGPAKCAKPAASGECRQ